MITRLLWLDEIDTALVQPEHRGNRVPPTHITVRVVCRPCNNGWMSRLETQVKPLLTPVIGGQDVDLDRAQCRLVAAWATKTAAMFEHNHPPTRAMEATQLRHVREQLAPPDGVSVWAFRTRDEQWGLRMQHDGATAVSDTALLDNLPARANVSSTTIGLNGLVLLVNFAPMIPHHLRTPPGRLMSDVTQLWPDPAGLTWPSPPISGERVDDLASAFLIDTRRIG